MSDQIQTALFMPRTSFFIYLIFFGMKMPFSSRML
uniref:Uncharacterized protein n=1 Tax=Anguilla anguilla TaxID=7936 RepID=A0A0E9PSN0_ANGAN